MTDQAYTVSFQQALRQRRGALKRRVCREWAFGPVRRHTQRDNADNCTALHVLRMRSDLLVPLESERALPQHFHLS